MAKLRAVLACLAALAFFLAAAWILWSTTSGLYFDLTASGSAGLGAVSIGISEMVVEYVLLALASLVVNRLLASWARSAGGTIKTWHRVHMWTIPAGFAALVVTIALVVATGSFPIIVLASEPLSRIFWAAQFVLTAALLCTYALRTMNPEPLNHS
jgi:hypothetical protein